MQWPMHRVYDQRTGWWKPHLYTAKWRSRSLVQVGCVVNLLDWGVSVDLGTYSRAHGGRRGYMRMGVGVGPVFVELFVYVSR